MCAENLALVVPALVAEDLASKPVAYQAKIDLNSGLRAGLRVYVTKALRPNWFIMKDRVGFVDRNPMPRIAAEVKRNQRNYRNTGRTPVRISGFL